MDTIECPKCGHEHEPTGSHNDDSGTMRCDSCDFAFVVEIDYDQSYATFCVEHKWGKFRTRRDRQGNLVECRFCMHCDRCQLREEADR